MIVMCRRLVVLVYEIEGAGIKGTRKYDNVAVEIGGTSVYEIDGAGTKWAPVKR